MQNIKKKHKILDLFKSDALIIIIINMIKT